MPNWTTMNLSELRVATKAQILTNINAWLTARTKSEIISLLMDATEIADPPVVTRNKAGELVRQVETVRDVGTGAVVSSKTIEWTYYPEGPVKEIIVSQRGDKGKELARQTIEHFTDGRQPTVSVAAIEEPVGEPVGIGR